MSSAHGSTCGEVAVNSPSQRLNPKRVTGIAMIDAPIAGAHVKCSNPSSRVFWFLTPIIFNKAYSD